eukprot:766691-Hanusia_phi.AAC.8
MFKYQRYTEHEVVESVLDQLESTAAVHVINVAMKAKYCRDIFDGFNFWNILPGAMSDSTIRDEARALRDEYICYIRFFSDIIRTSSMFQNNQLKEPLHKISVTTQVLLKIGNEMQFRYKDAYYICLMNHNNSAAVIAYVRKLMQMNTGDLGAFFRLSSLMYGSDQSKIEDHCHHFCVRLGLDNEDEEMKSQYTKVEQYEVVEQCHEEVSAQLSVSHPQPPARILKHCNETTFQMCTYSFQDGHDDGLFQQFQDDITSRAAFIGCFSAMQSDSSTFCEMVPGRGMVLSRQDGPQHHS